MSTFQRARRRLRAHPFALDAALAAGVLVCIVAGSLVEPHGPDGVTWALRTPDALSLVLMVLGAAALVLRRRAPLAVLAFTGGVSLVESVTGDPRAPVAMCVVVALYTVASATDRPTTWRVGLLTMTVRAAAPAEPPAAPARAPARVSDGAGDRTSDLRPPLADVHRRSQKRDP
ncbi:hypothetical protein SHIRM173S_13242 [Streptomyces hirsutus]